MCIDVTGSMAPTIDMVRRHALDLHGDLEVKLREKDRDVTALRVRVIAFRDVDYNDHPAFEVSDWLTLPDQASAFQTFVSGLKAVGGGDEPESALDALSIALNSDWTQACDRQRHIVVLWTDATSKPLSGGKPATVPAQLQPFIASNLDELTDRWNEPQGASLKANARRLLIYGPDCTDWNTLSEGWDEVMHFPSRAGDGLSEHDYAAILEILAASIA
jgi:hypothetical protein